MTAETTPRVRPGLRAEALLLAVAVRAGLRCLSFRRVVQALNALPRLNASSGDTIAECLAAASAGAAGAAHSTCLFRSFVTFALLARRNHDAAIHIGAARNPGFSAHAWVTVGGEAIEPSEASEYAPLWRHRARPPLGA